MTVKEERVCGDARSGHTLVRARSLVKRFGDFTAVAGIDFDIHRGESFGLLGPNGAGKTTTMRMLSCVSVPSGGELRILGRDPAREQTKIRERLGICPQADNLDLDLTVVENITTYARYFGMSRARALLRAAELLEFARLKDRAGDRVQSLSGGMKRRLSIARALANEPDMVLLDEPTTGLDPQARHLLWERLFRLKQRGTTLVISTHYMDEAEQLCDRLVIMDGGRIAAEGSPRELIEVHSSPEVVELRFGYDAADTYAGKLDGIGDRVDPLADRVLVYARDGDAVVNEVHRRGLRPASVLVRRSTLEDVFLRLTGRALVE
ncbi:ABC transporter ATP-binding protein [Streptomyces sp. NPDC059477]|uniref:ABC transporter ATP-binding protein n=1 Tax=Streptomyces sp. NPDC059477 TaxID=3346847 RepID=UPI0036CC4D50